MTLLVITPSVPVWKTGTALTFDRKFYDGILLYAQKWPGNIRCVMSQSSTSPPDFGSVTLDPKELVFECLVLGHRQPIVSNHLNGASIVLASGDSDSQLHLSKLCKENNIKCIYIIEYIPETRYQIVSLSTKNPIVRLRRKFHVWKMEQARVAAFSLCDGLQTNGTPAYATYSNVNNRLLYFDTRVFSSQIIDENQLQGRTDYLAEDKPIRLSFSGRLIGMKGADHLLRLALLLKQNNVLFELKIYGSGIMESEMRKFIIDKNLQNEVIMFGAVDFYDTLIPQLKQSVDIFVCLHRQSDPSCTYLETLSCGVPIVGYRNRAFGGLLDIANIGWAADLDDLDEICKIIIHLDRDRSELVRKSKNSLYLALKHDFDSTFQRRVDHLISTANGAMADSVN